MKKLIPLLLIGALACHQAYASFFDDIKNAVQNTAKATVTTMAAEMTADLIREMLIDYTTKQTKTDQEVSQEYEEENGSLPVNTIASSYTTEMLPGPAVSPGTKVTIKSTIEVIPGTKGKRAKIEEQLTIFDNEDNSVELKSMTKQAGKSKGGQFRGEFNFTLPEGLPQGVYPIRSTLLLNGELAGDQDHDLQLVMVVEQLEGGEMVASVELKRDGV